VKTEIFPEQVTFKITKICNARCLHCVPRKKMYESIKNCSSDLSLDIIKNVLNYSSSRGLQRITFSGGEPTLARNLPKAVEIATDYTGDIFVITNGWNTQEYFWNSLIEKGLSHVDISLDGYNESLQDWLRNRVGIFKHIMRLMGIFDNLCSKYPKFQYSILTIISHFNLLRLDMILKLILEHNVQRWVIQYPECDDDLIFSPSKWKQNKFRTNVLPIMQSIVSHKIKNESVAARIREDLSKIYDNSIINSNLSFTGNYHINLTDAVSCPVPGRFLLVKHDGNLFGCSGGEYTEDAWIGNACYNNSPLHFDCNNVFSLIKKRIPYCLKCPIPFNIKIFLK